MGNQKEWDSIKSLLSETIKKRNRLKMEKESIDNKVGSLKKELKEAKKRQDEINRAFKHVNYMVNRGNRGILALWLVSQPIEQLQQMSVASMAREVNIVYNTVLNDINRFERIARAKKRRESADETTKANSQEP